MSAASLLAEVEALGCRLEVRARDGRVILWADPVDLLPADLRDQLRVHRDELLALIGDAGNDDDPPPKPRPPEGTPERARHDAAQERAVSGLMLAAHAHTCTACGAWACYGFGPPGKAPTGWFCPLHRTDGERLRQRQ